MSAAYTMYSLSWKSPIIHPEYPGERHLVFRSARGRGDQNCGQRESRKGVGSKVSYPEQRLRRGMLGNRVMNG